MDQLPSYWIDFGKIILAFTLTSIFGTWIATFFQNRAWKQQREMKLKDEERSQAIEVFDEISKLLDRRLFRYRQIIYAFRAGDQKRIEESFASYREVLFEWNDNLNRNYSRLEIYFGKDARKRLEFEINKEIIFVGMLLERIKNGRENALPLETVWAKIDHINGLVYDFDRTLLRQIEESSIGQFKTHLESTER